MFDAIVFVAASAALGWISRHALRQPRSHGFLRFFAAECILALLVLGQHAVVADWWAPRQLASVALLLVALTLPLHAMWLLFTRGRPTPARVDPALFDFERTSTLVTSGAYRFIRHPMYAALLFLTWGLCLGAPSAFALLLALAASVLLELTARREEQECLAWFGESYRDYQSGTRRFVPFLW